MVQSNLNVKECVIIGAGISGIAVNIYLVLYWNTVKLLIILLNLGS